MDGPPRLSAKSLLVLKQIAEGNSYSRIVDDNPDLNYHDIFFAAEEAVWMDERIGSYCDRPSTSGGSVALAEPSAMELAKAVYPQAYAPWTEEDDEQLRSFISSGTSAQEIAGYFQRQPSAIKSRMSKLGLR